MALTPQMMIRIEASMAGVRKALAESTSLITTTTASMQKLATSLDGSKLIQNAHNIVAAVNSIGGASKLTDAEANRLRASLERAIEKAALMGKEIPKDMVAMAASMRRV